MVVVATDFVDKLWYNFFLLTLLWWVSLLVVVILVVIVDVVTVVDFAAVIPEKLDNTVWAFVVPF